MSVEINSFEVSLGGGGGGGGLVVALYVLSASLKMKWMLNNIYHLSLLNLLLQVLIGLKVKWGGGVGRGRGRERELDGEGREGEAEREGIERRDRRGLAHLTTYYLERGWVAF